MGFFHWVKGVIERMFFKTDAKRIFDTDILLSDTMDKAVKMWNCIYSGRPDWLDEENHIKTINFAKSVTSETARLACLDLSIKIDGSARASYLQSVIDAMFDNIRVYVEKGCANGTIILKPNGESVDCFTPQRFLVTETDGNGNIRGAIFFDFYTKSDDHFTRMEYHRFSDDEYLVSNRCFVSKSANSLGRPIDITKTPWSSLLPDVSITNLQKPLFAAFKTPAANNIDSASPLGMSIFAEAIEELKDLDVAYSRNTKEIYDSKRLVLADERLMQLPSLLDIDGNRVKRFLKMPDYVRNVMHDGADSFYQEINPNLNTDTRITGINHILSVLAYKCGYSNGYFSFDAMQGIQTATGVEASQQRTIQFIKDIRDKLQMTMNDLIYALDKYADLYDLAPLGVYEVTYGFGDICYNYEEDKKTWYGYAQAGKVPFWLYLTKFENMSEEEAKAICAEAKDENEPKENGLFGEE